MSPETTAGIGRAAEMGGISYTGVRFIIITVRISEERGTGLDNDIIGGQAERTDSGEEMGVIVEEMGINPAPLNLNTDSGVGITGTKLGRCDCGLLGTGEIYGTRGRDAVK